MTSRIRRLVSVGLLVGGVGAVLAFGPHAPKERKVDFRFDDDPGTLVRLDVSWVRVDEGSAADPVSGTSFRFERGHAPKIVRSNVHLPDGSYALDITLERADRTTSVQRTLTLGDADQITVPLR